MKKRIKHSVLLSICLCSLVSVAQDIDPKEESKDFLRYADAILLKSDLTFEVNSTNSATITEKYTIKVLNKEGLKYASRSVPYDKFNKIKTLKGAIYDDRGKRIQRIKSSDFVDFSYAPSYAGYSDTRTMHYSPRIAKYPYTIEYEVKVELLSSLNYPSWQPLSSYRVAVVESVFNLIVKDGISIKFLERNIEDEVAIRNEANYTHYQWKASNLPAQRPEPLSVGLSNFTPSVRVYPIEFQVEGYSGTMDSWKNFGLWFWELNKGRDAIPEATKQKVLELTHSADNDFDKAKIIYEYMQKNNRYVSIQLGIGGWQTIDASTVDRVGYGDCKALSNYTKALLDVVGVKSNYVLVNAGSSNHDIATKFPSNQFNHVILCVPFENDTIWLECTSQTAPFGYLGLFTSNRHVLVIENDGGSLIKTPSIPINMSYNSTIGEILINESGNANASFKSTYSGFQYDMIYGVLHSNPDDQKKWLSNSLSGANISVNSFSFSGQPNVIPKACIDYELTMSRFANVSQRRIFIPLKSISKNYSVPPPIDNRVSDFYIPYSWQFNDTIVLKHPDSYQIESIPKNSEIASEFGNFSVEYISDSPNEISYITRFSLKEGYYKAEKYNDLSDFYRRIASHENAQAVLTRRADK